jgi:Trk K+ transport system NAD-binding subunit
VRDYASMLHLYGDYAIHEMLIQEGDWLVGSTLGELRLKDEGLLVIGVVGPDGSYEGVPSASTQLAPGETAILYGRGEAFHALAERTSGRHGDEQHDEMVVEQQRVEARETAPHQSEPTERA